MKGKFLVSQFFFLKQLMLDSVVVFGRVHQLAKPTFFQ